MSTEDSRGSRARRPTLATATPALSLAAGELYAQSPLSAVLRQLLRHSRTLVGAMAGSVSLVDHERQRYAKMAEYGASCQLGRSFPLGEGVTGQVMTRRRPVVLASYRTVPTGHLPPSHPASQGSVVAVPIWWLGEVIGANVVFGGARPRFSTAEVDELEMLTQVAAPGIARAGNVSRPTGSATAATRPRTPLTPREVEVLQHLGLGMSDVEIADALGISRKTAEKHVGAILRKTGSPRRTFAIVRALESGWLELPQ